MNCASCGAPLQAGQTLCDACHGLAAPEPRTASGIAGFKAGQELGSGRFSQTWLVRGESGAPLVLKLLRRDAPQADQVQRFIEETQRLAALPRHPHVAWPLAGGVHLVSTLFLVYEHGGETTLQDELRASGRLPLRRALLLCAQLCEGLAVLHAEAIAHLDVKPGNVGIVTGERAVLLDGCTKHLLSHVGLDRDEELPLSSAGYAAPEAAQGARSDLYSLGALLFQLVSGRLPLAGTSAAELRAAHRDEQPASLASCGVVAPPELEALLAALLSKDPVRRPPDAMQVGRTMRSIADQLEEMGPVTSLALTTMPALPPAVTPRRRSRRTFALAGCGACAAVAALVLWHRAPAEVGMPAVVPQLSTAPLAEGAFLTEPPNETTVRPKTATSAPRLEAAPQRESGTSPYARPLERAQKALWTDHPASAIAILRPLLAQPLNERDRARAQRLMSEATAREGAKGARRSHPISRR